jgi:hypothetical protein
MKRISFLITLGVLLGTLAIAQKQKEPVPVPDLPMNMETSLYSYSAVVEVHGIGKDELYTRAFNWANSYYKNPVDVIREKDPQAGKLLIKARYKISNEPDKKGVATQAGDVMYSLTMNFKDGRYRYEITKINWQQLSYYPIERWKDQTASSYKPVYAYYLKQTDETIKALITDFMTKIAVVPKSKPNDW